MYSVSRVSPPAPFPHTAVCAKFPPPRSVTVFPLSAIAPSVSCVPKLTLKTAAPVRVVAPNVTPAVPLFTFAPIAVLNVFPPMDNVPNVCVTPAPALTRSETIVAFPEIVVLRLKPSALSFASSSRPPEILKVATPVPSAFAFPCARNVPADTITPPVKVFAPESTSLPLPILVRLNAPLTTLLAASVRPAATSHDWSAARATSALTVKSCDAALISIPPPASVSVFPPAIVTAPDGDVTFKPRIEKFVPRDVFKFATAPASNTAVSAATGAAPPTQFPPVLHTASVAPLHEIFAAVALTANKAANGSAQIRIPR